MSIDTSIQIGDFVRSYDFPDYLEAPGITGDVARSSFVDGQVIDICLGIVIKIERSIYGGKPWVYDPPRTKITVPMNGAKLSNRRIANHVVRRTA